ncbi:MAG: cobalamin-binding protein [Tissierellia bacterium]|jgi:methanogenic corrinoid protein MtbC1|nr:cobalamin-binding protein [Tissierellia bacterium]
MVQLYEKLLDYLKQEDKEKALDLCISSLENGDISVVDLYQSVLRPALNNIIKEYLDDEDNLIWKEHLRSGIIRTIVENSYPYVLKERDKIGNKNGDKVIVMCPRFEDHDLGARMVSDFFTIAGFETTFIGANTPERTILKAIQSIKPKYLSISVTNYYNLIATKKTIEQIKNAFEYKIIFLLGGNAFNSDPNTYKDVGGDFLLKSFEEILNLSRKVGSN